VLKAWLGILLVLAVLGLLMAALRFYQSRCRPHPEWVRKLLHVSMGLVTLSFPWLFDASWPVFVLAALASAGLLSVRLVKRLRTSLGCVIGGVERTSWGEVYFPIGVALVFDLARGAVDVSPVRRVLLYCVPILCLTLADALAALIGLHFGRLRYPTVEGHKSAEGSLTFFGVALCGTYWPLLGWEAAGRLQAFLIALLLAFLAMMFEAVAWGGLDNLILPLASFLLLHSYLLLPVEDLLLRLAVTAALALFVLLYARRTTLTGSALPAAVLVGYLSWALGGWQWLTAPLLFFASYTLMAPWAGPNTRRVHNVDAVLCVSSAGLLWLFLNRILGDSLAPPGLRLPFMLAFAAHFALIAIARLRRGRPTLSTTTAQVRGIAVGWSLLLLSLVLVEERLTTVARYALPGLLSVTLASLLFCWLQPGMEDCPTDAPRWLRQGASAALGSLVGLLPLSGLA
jgi:phytol kinase